ncbi:MAG: hypothetical protein AB7O71_25700, partial [Hyphomicrobiaceae bacterium]
VAAIKIPKLQNSARWSYIKIRRKAGAFADALAAVVVDPERDRARVVIGSSGTGVCRLPQAESALGSNNGAEAAEASREELRSRADILDDYQLHIQSGAVRRALEGVLA